MKLNMTVENILIPMSVVSVLVFCISSKRLQYSIWVSTMKPSGVRKNSYQKLMFHNNSSNGDRTKVFTCTSSPFQHLQNGAKSRQYPPKHSCYKRINTALRIASILVALRQVMGAEGRVYLSLRIEMLICERWNLAACVLIFGHMRTSICEK
jgi:hypothetical protein